MAGMAGETDRSRAGGSAHLRPEPGARGAAGPAQPDGGGAGPVLDKNGRRAPVAAGPPPAWRRALAAAYAAFRRVAMVGPSDEELDRMEEEDRRANTEWILGGTVGIVHEFTEFGARRDDYGEKPV